MRHRRHWSFVLAALLVAAAVPGRAQPEKTPARPQASSTRPNASREGLDAREADLDRAVDRVSLPQVAHLLGRQTARGYRLPGYGVVFVLPPRSLPGTGDFRYHLGSPRTKIQLRMRRTPPAETAPQEIESLERHVLVLQSATEETRRAAEEDMDRLASEMRVRVGVAEGEPTTPPSGSSAAGPGPRPPIAPPWKFWFEAALPHDERTPQTVIADVREALIETILRQPAHVVGLRPEEFVVVAVDFENMGPRPSRPPEERTLIVRCRAGDIAARAHGRIAAEELRRRLEVIEY